MDGWNTRMFPFGEPYCQVLCYVSFREGNWTSAPQKGSAFNSSIFTEQLCFNSSYNLGDFYEFFITKQVISEYPIIYLLRCIIPKIWYPKKSQNLCFLCIFFHDSKCQRYQVTKSSPVTNGHPPPRIPSEVVLSLPALTGAANHIEPGPGNWKRVHNGATSHILRTKMSMSRNLTNKRHLATLGIGIFF